MLIENTLATLKIKMSKLSNQELLQILKRDFANYSDEALYCAKAELMTRGIAFDASSARLVSESKVRFEADLAKMDDVGLFLSIASYFLLGGLAVLLMTSWVFLAYFLVSIDSRMLYPSEFFVFYLIYVISFATAGAFGAVFFRSHVGLNLITAKYSAVIFTVAGVIGGALIGMLSSPERFFHRVIVIGSVSYLIGVMLSWSKARSSKNIVQTISTRLPVDDKE
jgi:hypothetical protein